MDDVFDDICWGHVRDDVCDDVSDDAWGDIWDDWDGALDDV